MVLVSSAPLFAAYGSQGDPFSANNLVLAISLGIWLAGDELSDLLTGERRIQGGLLRDVDVWSYLAPFANLLTGWWLLRDQPHERFVTGIVVFSDASDAPEQPDTVRFSLVASTSVPEARYVYTWSVDLAERVSADHAEQLRSYSDVAAFATIRAAIPAPTVKPALEGVTSTVSNGILTIRVEATGPAHLGPILASVEVAWIVDTHGSA